ncbi:SRPBCC domain-containing protein [Kitasatospora sp. NPDC007106]|uniref:SRPBCC domain-containing protein n=1 Tax=Kitasatospora sp. NPDC007106 TaxID=3156914 RepID=UPI0033F0C5F1
MEHEVVVPLPANAVRQVLQDSELLARCVPGLSTDAGTSRTPDGQVDGRLRLRVGSSTITYRGSLSLIPGREGVLTALAEGEEVRGSGEVTATVRVSVHDHADGSVMRFAGDLSAEGRLAEFPDDVLETAGRRLLDRLVAALAVEAGAGPDAVLPPADDETEETAEETAAEPAEAEAGAEPAAETAEEPAVEAEAEPAAVEERAAEAVEEPAADAEPEPEPAPVEEPQEAAAEAEEPETPTAPVEEPAAEAVEPLVEEPAVEAGAEPAPVEEPAVEELRETAAEAAEPAESAQEAEEAEEPETPAVPVQEPSVEEPAAEAVEEPEAEAEPEAEPVEEPQEAAAEAEEPGGPDGESGDEEEPGATVVYLDDRAERDLDDDLSDLIAFSDEDEPLPSPEPEPAGFEYQPEPAASGPVRRSIVGRSAEEVDHAPPHGRYAPTPPARSARARAASRWGGPEPTLLTGGAGERSAMPWVIGGGVALIGGAVVLVRALRRR